MSYREIKEYVRRRIGSGAWRPGTRIPSENELTRQFGVARMTAHRALSELARDGLLGRTQGSGTFVAELLPVSSFLRVRDIHEEIVERGHRHRLDCRRLGAERCPKEVAGRLEVAPGSRVFRVRVVHHENDVPVQVEERWVNPRVAPGFLGIDLAAETPGHYLTRVAPLTEAEHIIEARAAGNEVRMLLKLKRGEPCLVVLRRTWVRRRVAAYAILSHPGSVYRLVGRFKP